MLQYSNIFCFFLFSLTKIYLKNYTVYFYHSFSFSQLLPGTSHLPTHPALQLFTLSLKKEANMKQNRKHIQRLATNKKKESVFKQKINKIFKCPNKIV